MTRNTQSKTKTIETRVLKRIQEALKCRGVGLYRNGEWQTIVSDESPPIDAPPGKSTFSTSLDGINYYWCNIMTDVGEVLCWGFFEVRNSLIHSMIQEMAKALPEPDEKSDEKNEE